MPIPIDQFEKGLHPDQLKIIQLLESNTDKAYTSNELATAMEKSTGSATALERILERMLLTDQLNNLAIKGLIRSKTVGNEVYYAALPKSKGIKP